MSRSVLLHGSRQVRSWLIFDVGPLRILSMRMRSESNTPAKVLKQTSAEPLACSIAQMNILRSSRSVFRASARAAARVFWCQQRPGRVQRRDLVRHSHPVQPSCFRSLLPRSSGRVLVGAPFACDRSPFTLRRNPDAQQGARANVVTCHGSCCACSAPVPAVAHL